MKVVTIAALMVAAAFSGAAGAEESVMKELAPTGELRVGVAYAPAPTPLFVVKDAKGEPHGVASDIGLALGKSLGLPVKLVVEATTNQLAEDCVAGKIDVGFMPADATRRALLDFSSPYFVIESTYIATAPSGIKTMAEVDRPGVTVVGIDGSTTMRAAARSLHQAKVVTAKSVDEAMAMLKTGAAQAFALTHDSLPALQKDLPGSIILDGAFQVTGVGIAMAKNKPEALAYVTNFIEKAKADGTIQRFFDAAGLKGVAVAAPAK